MGATVYSFGDINADGIADVYVSAISADGGGTDRGQGYIFYGSTTISSVNLSSDGTASLTYTGATNSDFFGRVQN